MKQDIKKEIAKQKEYERKEKIKKDKIKLEPNKWKRFWKYVFYYTMKPLYWLKDNITDWRTAIIFVISMVLVSSSVWAFYLGALICGWTTDTAKWLISIGSVVWLWWLGGASPFLLICITITIFIKGIFDKIRFKKYNK